MSTAQAVAERRRGRGALAALCCAILFLYAVYLSTVGVLMPAVRQSFHLSAAMAGWLFPANFTGFVLGVVICGYLSDRLGRKRVILLGISLYAAGLVLFGGAPVFPVVLLGTACIGAGTGAAETVASALASDLYPERRAFILNAIQVAFGVGAACSPLLANYLLTGGIPWPRYYFALAALNVVLLGLLASRQVPRAATTEALDLASLRHALLRPAFGTLCLAQALYVGAEVSFFSWMPSLFQDRFAGGGQWAGMVVTLFWVAMTVGRIAAGTLVGRMPLYRLIALLAGGGAACSALALLVGSPMAVMGFVGATGLCFSSIWPLILAEGGERFPGMAGTVFGGIVAAGGTGGAVVPWAAGALAGLSGNWQIALVLVPLSSAGVGLLMTRLHRLV